MKCSLNLNNIEQRTRVIYLFLLLTACSFKIIAQPLNEYTLKVESMVANSEKKTYGQWKWYNTRTIQTLNGFKNTAVIKTNKYGSRTDKKFKATGFFYSAKINNRWWIIDPDGYCMINIALNNVATAASDSSLQLMQQKYGE